MTTVFLVRRPLAHILQTDAEIRTGKWSWAITKDGQRYLVGATAFFTHQSAVRCRFAKLMEYTKNMFLRLHCPCGYDKALRLLKEYKEKGVAAWPVRTK